MAQSPLGGTPFPVVIYDTNSGITEEQLQRIIDVNESGVSLCVRSAQGPEKRGGYFFHFRHSTDPAGLFELSTFDRAVVDNISIEFLVRLINHTIGYRFDPDIFNYCQNTINFRQD
jgi:hypothetical protein